MTDLQQLTFDYAALDDDTRTFVQHEDQEFDRNAGDAAASFVRACHNLKHIHAALKYKRPGFVDYCNSKPGLAERTAYRMLDVAEMFAENANISIESKEALYLLAAPSTPDSAREEAVARAEAGENITHSTAKDIVANHKDQPLTYVDDPDINQAEPEFRFISDEGEILKYQPGDRAWCPECGMWASFARLGSDRFQHLTCGYQVSNDDITIWQPDYDDKPRPEASSHINIPEASATPNPHIILNSSESNEWYTPSLYIEAARRVMGAIDLDPASCDFANRVVRATTYYTITDDGLSKPWYGRTWLNPPYGKNEDNDSNQGVWSSYLIGEYHQGHVTEAILLVNAVPDREWFQPLWNHLICFPSKRIRFYSEDKPDGGSPTHPSAFVYFGDRPQKFIEVFSAFGPIVVECRKTALLE